MMIAAAVGVVVMLCAYVFIFIEIRHKNNQVSILQNQLDIEIRKDERLRTVKQLLADLDADISRLDTHFVSSESVVDFLEQLESLGALARTRVNVNSVNVVSQTDPSLPYEKLKIDFFSEGSWASVLQVVSLLETLPVGVSIERLQLERLSQSGFWGANISFTVLKLKQ